MGGFYFDPQAQFENTWVRLKPLGTEGQDCDDRRSTNNLQICVPMGVGLRKAFSKQLSGGLELQYTKTFTDYIDDVSTVYYDNEALRVAHDDVGAFLADPSLGLQEIGDPTAAGQQRGDDTDLDAYLFMKFQLHYKLIKYKSGSKKYRTRIRRQKIVF